MENKEFENTATNDGPAFDFMAEIVNEILNQLQKQNEAE